MEFAAFVYEGDYGAVFSFLAAGSEIVLLGFLVARPLGELGHWFVLELAGYVRLPCN